MTQRNAPALSSLSPPHLQWDHPKAIFTRVFLLGPSSLAREGVQSVVHIAAKGNQNMRPIADAGDRPMMVNDQGISHRRLVVQMF